MSKRYQIQIRVSQKEKERIRLSAKKAGMEMSEWVLASLFPPLSQDFQKLIFSLSTSIESSFPLAEINDFLSRLDGKDLAFAVAEEPEHSLSSFLKNYLAAMIELACFQKKIPCPNWVHEVEPLMEPYFGADLKSLRLYLLQRSPPSFRKRNIFIDSSIRDRV